PRGYAPGPARFSRFLSSRSTGPLTTRLGNRTLPPHTEPAPGRPGRDQPRRVLPSPSRATDGLSLRLAQPSGSYPAFDSTGSGGICTFPRPTPERLAGEGRSTDRPALRKVPEREADCRRWA